VKFVVKKECWHKGRRLMPGDTLEVEGGGVKWLEAQGKVTCVECQVASGSDDKGQAQGQPEQRRRGRGRAAAEETNVPEAPAAIRGDDHE
jgi:hypothetical protein